MAIGFTEPKIEGRLERLADRQPVPTSKKGLALAILDRATRMKSDELYDWLRQPAASPVENATAPAPQST